MRFLRAVAVAVVLSAAVIAGVALLGGDEVAGTARPMDKRSLLATCEYDQFDVDVDVDTVTYGPMILDHIGELKLLAITPTGTVINCSTYGVMGVYGPSGPAGLPPGTKICEYTYFAVPSRSGFTGSGCATPDVARVEVVVLDGPPIEVVPENGLFLYTAPHDIDDIDPIDGIVVRAYDKDGRLLQEL